MSHPILELQAADTLAEQLRHRRDHLPEAEQLDAARSAFAAWDRRRAELQGRLDELDVVIARSEADSHDIDVKRVRLEQQLKTIFAPREAEALMNQIAGLKQRRSELDDAELEALEEQARVDDELSAHRTDEEALRAAVTAAEGAASAAIARIEADLADIAARLGALRLAVGPELLDRYDRLRKHHVVAVAVLNVHRCEGCHLDLAAHEVDEVREMAAGGGFADCPQCGRLLVVP